MKPSCPQWKDALLEAALTGAPSGELKLHISHCPACTAQLVSLQARRSQLDALLPLVAQSAEPSPDFRVRVLAAAASLDESRRRTFFPARVAAAALSVAAIILAFALAARRAQPPTGISAPAADLAAAERLAQWRAPSDVFLVTPGREILRSTPKLGDSYLRVPAKLNQEN